MVEKQETKYTPLLGHVVLSLLVALLLWLLHPIAVTPSHYPLQLLLSHAILVYRNEDPRESTATNASVESWCHKPDYD